jgi:hypothetical protein
MDDKNHLHTAVDELNRIVHQSSDEVNTAKSLLSLCYQLSPPE